MADLQADRKRAAEQRDTGATDSQIDHAVRALKADNADDLRGLARMIVDSWNLRSQLGEEILGWIQARTRD